MDATAGPDAMTVLTVLQGLPAWSVLLLAVALPALEASTALGVVVPGEAAVLVAGAFAHAGGPPLWAVVAGAAAGAVAGDQVGYRLGRRARRRILDSRRPSVRRAARAVRRHGALAVAAGRWAAVLRAVVPAVAGAGGVPPRAFTVANALGGVTWAAAVALAGYGAGAGLSAAAADFGRAGTVLAAVLASAAAGAALLGRRRRRSRG